MYIVSCHLYYVNLFMKTPQQFYPDLSRTLCIPEVYLKREDLHVFGSHKGRSIPIMMKEYLKKGQNQFAISSSGNAAFSAGLFAKKHNQNNLENQIALDIYVGKKIGQEKYDRLASLVSSRIQLFQTERPKQQALQAMAEGKINLRQSTDDLALIGYHELAKELIKIPNLSAVFVPTSSGTTAQALAEACLLFTQKTQIHVVQTTACHPIVSTMKNEQIPNSKSTSLASAIVDQVAHRKEKVLSAVKKTGGDGWIINEEEIKQAIELTLNSTGLKISPNSALSVAGLRRAVASGWSWQGAIVCLITGA